MIATWVLIMTLTGGNGGGIATQEFSSKERCEAAGKATEELRGFSSSVRFVCVIK